MNYDEWREFMDQYDEDEGPIGCRGFAIAIVVGVIFWGVLFWWWFS